MIIEGKELEIQMNGKTYHCALDITMDFIGGKWKTVVLWYLRKGCKRFSELKKLIPAITEKMLSLQLKQLEKDEIIQRKIYAEVPPRVEYSLTKKGQTLLPVLEAIAAWGRNTAATQGTLSEKKRSSKKGRKPVS